MEYLAVLLKNGGIFMSIIIGFLLFLLGGSIGVIFMCLLQVSSNSDDKYLEYELSKDKTEFYQQKNKRGN